MKFHPDPLAELLVAFSEDDCSVRLWSLATSKCLATFSDHMSTVTSVAFSPDYSILASSGRDKVLNFYSVEEKKLLKTAPIYESVEQVVAIGTSTWATAGDTGKILFWTSAAKNDGKLVCKEVKREDVAPSSDAGEEDDRRK